MFFFNLSPNIKLPHVLPKDPAFDLTILLSNNEEFLVQKALISEYSKYFQQLSSLKGLTNIVLSPELGNSSLISRIFHAIYGDIVTFQVEELQELDRILDNLDCKRIKDLLKNRLKDEILKTDSFTFFFTVFDHFAIRDHKKFCKESLRRLNELNFFKGISQEIERFERNLLMNLRLLSERGIIKLLALLLQDQMRQRNGDKAREELCEILKEIVGFYAGELLKKPEKAQSLYQDLLLEVSPLEKKYCDKDVISTLQKEISQLKKANQSLNSQIQGLRAKESENKGKFGLLFKRIERLEIALKIEGEEDHKEKKEISHLGNKFEEYLMNEENKKKKPVLQKKKPNEEIKENSGKKLINNNVNNQPNGDKNQMNNGENQRITDKKLKSSFGAFNNENSLNLLIDFLSKTQEIYKEKPLVFNRVYEGSKQKFLLKKLVDLCKTGLLKEGVLLLIRTDCDKTIGAFFSKGFEANIIKDDKSFIFTINPFRVFLLKEEFKGKNVVFFNEESIRIGEDLMVFNEGNKSMNSMDLGHYYSDYEEIANNNGNNSGKVFFLLKELMVLGIKTIG